MAKSVEEYKKEIVRQMKAHRIYSKGSDKLRGMLSNSAPAFGNVQFEIKGRTPVGILKKENNIINRS